MRVLFVTPEAHPLVKTGGLGDVAGALPAALREIGLDARLLLPAYPGLIDALGAQPLGGPLRILPDMLPVHLFQGRMPDGATPVYLIDAPSLYHRSGIYGDSAGTDWPDNAFRFGVLSRTAAILAVDGEAFGWLPQVVHCNDWQTGLAPAYLAHVPGNRTRSVFSIHNMAFQGNFPPRLLPHLDLPRSSFSVQGIELHGEISFLKAGLHYADALTTVSLTYAQEIQRAEFGFGLEGLLRLRSDRLHGILNGVDTAHWNPASDPNLPLPYDSRQIANKAASKRALQQRFGLRADADTPLLGLVGRLTQQKGIDLVLAIADRLLEQPVQLVVLGSGEENLEAALQRLHRQTPQQVGLHVGYNEPLAHLIEAGADMFLMPSRFEPCGLNQMYSLIYGTPPIVRRTGGLADTVVDASPRTIEDASATGFVFERDTPEDLWACVLRALLLYQNRGAWRQLQRVGMGKDFSWQRSAQQYAELYRSLLQDPQTAPGGAVSRKDR